MLEKYFQLMQSIHINIFRFNIVPTRCLYFNSYITNMTIVSRYKSTECAKFIVNEARRKHVVNKGSISQTKSLTSVHDQTKSLHLKSYLQYQSLSTNDPILNKLLITLRSQKKINRNNLVILEGRRLISTALQSHMEMDTLLFSREDQLLLLESELNQSKSTSHKIYKVPQHILKLWSVLSTTPGLLALFNRPANTNFKQSSSTQSVAPITVVCDNIRDPSNIGSIIRTCAAIPCHQVIVMKGCCDPWSSKALRGGCGGQFHIQICDDVSWDKLKEYLPVAYSNNYSVYIAENNMDKVKSYPFIHKTCETSFIDYSDVGNSEGHSVVVIGGETYGVSTDAYRFLDYAGQKSKFLHIPLADGVESLNVASALTLILYELKKKVI